MSERLSQSAKETRAYGEGKKAEAKEHQTKADQLNDRIQGRSVPAAQNALEKEAARTVGRAGKAIGSYDPKASEKTALEAGRMAKDLGKAVDRRDAALLDVGDFDLTSERDKEQRAADDANKEAAAAEKLADHLERGSQQKAEHRDTSSTSSSFRERIGEGHGLR